MIQFISFDGIVSEFEPVDTKTLVCGGCMAECVCKNGEYTVRRIVSTDLKHYLNPNFSPGSVLKVLTNTES